MENRMKFYYLAEKSGWNMSSYAFSYRPSLGELASYKVLSVNVIEAKDHRAASAQNIVKEFEGLKLEPRTIEETFILETKLNYLALHSYPEYYLNPLAIDPNYSGDVTSIGELMVDSKGKDYSINELIQSDEIPLEEKKDALREKCAFWLEEMDELVGESIKTVKERAFSDKKRSRGKQRTFRILDIVSCVAVNLFFLFQLLIPCQTYWECFYSPSADHVLSYVSYLFPIFLFLYDIVFLIYHTYSTRISEPYNYARRFLYRHGERVYEDIQQEEERLLLSLLGAVNDKILLENDITSYSKLSSSYVDFVAVFEAEKLRKGKVYRTLHSLINIFRTLTFSLSIFTLLVYLLAYFFAVPF